MLPYDDRETLVKKLSKLRFKLDDRTGAIMIDTDADASGRVGYKMSDSAALSATEGSNEILMSLLREDVYRK